MREQPIVRVVNAVQSQGRAILWLACKHTVTISPLAYHANQPRVGELVMCIHCPDPTPEQVRDEKSPTQLWREAGEPDA